MIMYDSYIPETGYTIKDPVSFCFLLQDLLYSVSHPALQTSTKGLVFRTKLDRAVQEKLSLSDTSATGFRSGFLENPQSLAARNYLEVRSTVTG